MLEHVATPCNTPFSHLPKFRFLQTAPPTEAEGGAVLVDYAVNARGCRPGWSQRGESCQTIGYRYPNRMVSAASVFLGCVLCHLLAASPFEIQSRPSNSHDFLLAQPVHVFRVNWHVGAEHSSDKDVGATHLAKHQAALREKCQRFLRHGLKVSLGGKGWQHWNTPWVCQSNAKIIHQAWQCPMLWGVTWGCGN